MVYREFANPRLSHAIPAINPYRDDPFRRIAPAALAARGACVRIAPLAAVP
ncbi:hypothetical protein Ga0102493_111665 [Erythrobacter litoralis]|jgi:hypothetical protein|nr:hypothetical protein Ga0102493_111665 [Erythrobacter litoralis]